MLDRRDDPAAKIVSARLRILLPNIQDVLAHTSSPVDFTLHDAQHSFRVAERMIQIISPDVLEKLSVYELGLLLLSAYLHDIGMTPARRHVELHYHYLLTGNPPEIVNGDIKKLTDKDLIDFQRWLDQQPLEIAIPISSGTPTSENLMRAEELIAYYCRERHNDWSKVWITENLPETALGSYSSWVTDLIALCQSHNWSYLELVKTICVMVPALRDRSAPSGLETC